MLFNAQFPRQNSLLSIKTNHNAFEINKLAEQNKNCCVFYKFVFILASVMEQEKDGGQGTMVKALAVPNREALFTLRKRTGLTQGEVEERCNIHRGYLTHYENGRRARVEDLTALANFYTLRLRQLITLRHLVTAESATVLSGAATSLLYLLNNDADALAPVISPPPLGILPLE